VGIDNNMQIEDRFYDKFTSLARGPVGQGQPVADINTRDIFIINNSNVFTFNASKLKGSFTDNNTLDIFVGQEMYRKSTKENNVRNTLFPVDITYEKALALMSLGTAFPGFPNSNQYQESLLSYFGKVNYSYKQKYLIGASLRADGSSKFAPENR